MVILMVALKQMESWMGTQMAEMTLRVSWMETQMAAQTLTVLQMVTLRAAQKLMATQMVIQMVDDIDESTDVSGDEMDSDNDSEQTDNSECLNMLAKNV